MASTTATADARAQQRPSEEAILMPLLLILTSVTGIVDAVSYLRLNHTFVANMTGNIVFMGFAAAGPTGVSFSASLVAVAAFLAGSFAGGVLAQRGPAGRGRLLAAAASVEVAVVAIAAGLAETSPWTNGIAYVPIALLSCAMGLQNATARKIAIPDMTTTVLTLTLTGLAADSPRAPGGGKRTARRLGVVAAMLLGGFIGASVGIHVNVAATLGVAAVLLAVTAGWAYLRCPDSVAA